MNNKTKLQTFLLASLLIAFSVVSASFGAQAPERMDYQGYIVDGFGSPINDTLTVILSIHDASTGGNQKWTETQNNIEILDGILNVTLGAVTALKDTVFNADTRWLEIKVGTTTFDRVRLVSSAYALRIQTVDGATGGTLTGFLTAGKGNFGTNNTNAGTDAFAAGSNNVASGNYSVVGGGQVNEATGSGSTVSGGSGNKAKASTSIIGGGSNNFIDPNADDGFIGGGLNDTIKGQQPVIGGGVHNVIDNGPYSAILGGQDNRISSSSWSFLGGGINNKISGRESVICGGGRGLTSEGNTASGGWTFIGGGNKNTVSGTFAVVVGGETNEVSGQWATNLGGQNNINRGDWSTIGGGQINVILDTAFNATISGGHLNTIADDHAVICGGHNNLVQGRHGMIPGGRNCQANGDYSIAFGHFAIAAHDGAFVWADSTNNILQSTAKNQFLVRASGGVKFFSNQDTTTGVELSAGGGSWSSISDSTKKTNIREVDYQAVLSKLESMPVKQWSYKSQSENIEHIGPMAQDFYAAFGLGDDNLTINTIDPDGIALAAIKALRQTQRKLQESVNGLKTVRAELDDLRALVTRALAAQSTKTENTKLASNDVSN